MNPKVRQKSSVTTKTLHTKRDPYVVDWSPFLKHASFFTMILTCFLYVAVIKGHLPSENINPPLS